VSAPGLAELVRDAEGWSPIYTEDPGWTSECHDEDCPVCGRLSDEALDWASLCASVDALARRT
jgi:hypothetical protein